MNSLFHLKEQLRKARQKKMDAEDGVMINDWVFINEKEMRKKRNNQKRKHWVREIFVQRESHGAYNILWKELRLKDRELGTTVTWPKAVFSKILI